MQVIQDFDEVVQVSCDCGQAWFKSCATWVPILLETPVL